MTEENTETVRAKKRTVRAALGFAAATAGVAALGALVMRGRGSPNSLWFRALKKPSFQPPNKAFGPIWTLLYAGIAYSGYRIWRAPKSPERSVALSLWGAQLILNGMWTPLFFGMHKPRAALVDAIALDAAALGYAATAAKVDPKAAGLVVPYLGWLGLATAINSSIVMHNPRFMT
ncbi:MAG: TspO/MBR family protein [Kofleriaceae bacterium]